MSYLKLSKDQLDMRRPTPKEQNNDFFNRYSLNYFDFPKSVIKNSNSSSRLNPNSLVVPHIPLTIQKQKQLFENKKNNFMNSHKNSIDSNKENVSTLNRFTNQKRRIKSYQLDAVQLITNRLQRYLQGTFNVIKDYNESYDEDIKQSYLCDESIKSQQDSFQIMRADHIMKFQDQLNKIEDSIKMSSDHQSQVSLINGFKVSFGNLNQLKKSNQPSNRIVDRVKELKSMMNDLYEQKSEKSEKSEQQSTSVSPPMATQYFSKGTGIEVEKTITSFECNFSSLKESRFDQQEKSPKSFEMDKSAKYSSLAKIKDEEITKLESLEDFLCEGQSMLCSYAFPHSNRQTQAMSRLCRLSFIISSHENIIKSQSLQQIQVFALVHNIFKYIQKEHLMQMSQTISHIKQDALRRILVQKSKMQRIILSVCFEQWIDQVQYQKVSQFNFERLLKIFQLRQQGVLTQIKHYSLIKVKIQNTVNIIQRVQHPIFQHLKKILFFEKGFCVLLDIKWRRQRECFKHIQQQSRLRSQERLPILFERLQIYRDRSHTQEAFKQIQLYGLIRLNRQKKIKLILVVLQDMMNQSMLRQGFQQLNKRRRVKGDRIRSRLLYYVIKQNVQMRLFNTFSVLMRHQHYSKPNQSICQSFVLDDQTGISQFEQYKAMFQK